MLKSIKSFFYSKQQLNREASKAGLLEIGEQEREQLQKTLFEMYCDIDIVCKKHGLTVFLCGGSALGAIRHKGFIPWDDDLDLAMTRKEYTKFVKIFEKELTDKYELTAPNYHHTAKSRFPKILKKGTLFREATDSRSDPKHCGVFLDIFIIENAPDNHFIRKIKGSYCNILEFIGGKVGLYENRCEALEKLYSQVSPRNYRMNMFIGKMFSFKKASSWYDQIDKIVRCKNETSKECCLPTGRKHYFGEILPRETFFPAATAVFEGKEAMVFGNVDHYLKNLYGDYMVIPTPENREKHFIVEMKL